MQAGLTPDWPAPASVRALCTTRGGGVSLPPFDAFNLALHVGDDPDAVRTNRARLQAAIGARPVFLQQVHGTDHVALDRDSCDGLRADACSTSEAALACTVMVADCLPVLLCDATGRRVAAVHAGWRGLAGGVLQSALAAFDAPDVGAPMAWLGPCIGARAFEVGTEVRQVFMARQPGAEAFFRPGQPRGKWWADLAGLARLQLRALGVGTICGNDGSPAWCTVAQTSRFFSHRRDGVGAGGTGRFAACIWRVD